MKFCVEKKKIKIKFLFLWHQESLKTDQKGDHAEAMAKDSLSPWKAGLIIFGIFRVFFINSSFSSIRAFI